MSDTDLRGKRLRFKGEGLLSRGAGAKNPHALAVKAGRSREAILSYTERYDDLVQVDLRTLPAIYAALGFDADEFMQLTLADLFDLVGAEEVASVAR